MFCSNCGKEIDKNSDVCLNCGKLVRKNNEIEDKPDVFLNVISFILPLIGVIIYLIIRKDTPIQAKSVIESAKKSVTLVIIIMVILGIIFAIKYLIGNTEKITDNTNSYTELVKAIDENNIKKIIIVRKNKNLIKAIYKEQNEEKEYSVPSIEALKELVNEKGIEIVE